MSNALNNLRQHVKELRTEEKKIHSELQKEKNRSSPEFKQKRKQWYELGEKIEALENFIQSEEPGTFNKM